MGQFAGDLLAVICQLELPLPGSRDPTPTPSIYKENPHALTAVVSVEWFMFGGSLFTTSGSRPTQYYQPLARFSLLLNKYAWWNTEWRWYSMSEAFYAFEDSRSNQLMPASLPELCSQECEQHARMRALEADRNQTLPALRPSPRYHHANPYAEVCVAYSW